MSNEIKVGDKVRVREDAPRMYVSGCDHVYLGVDSTVIEIEDGNAVIRLNSGNTNVLFREIAIPTKYLVKVEEEKKLKFKIGDKVIFIPTGKVKVVSRINANSLYTVTVTEPNGQSPLCVRETELAPYIEHNAPKFKVGDRVRNVKSDLCGIALKIEHGIVEVGIPYDKERHYWNTDIVELFEPTEQTEAEKKKLQNMTASELRDLANHGVSVGDEVKRRIKERDDKPNVGSIKIPVEVDLSDSYWDAYAADLAKEVALKVANKYNDPEQAADYAVSVAKAVVEGLKRK